MRFLPDTNVWIDLMRPSGDRRDLDRFDELTAEADIILSALCRFELESGVLGRKGAAGKRRALDVLLAMPFAHVSFDFAAAVEASRIAAYASSIGREISVADAMFAGHVAALGAALLTGDARIRDALPDDVATLDWVAPSQVARGGSARP